MRYFCHIRFITGPKIFLLHVLLQSLLAIVTICLFNQRKHFKFNTEVLFKLQNNILSYEIHYQCKKSFIKLTNLFSQSGNIYKGQPLSKFKSIQKFTLRKLFVQQYKNEQKCCTSSSICHGVTAIFLSWRFEMGVEKRRTFIVSKQCLLNDSSADINPNSYEFGN